MPPKEKRRLDTVIQEKYPHLTRNQIQSFILQGKVKIDGKPLPKAGTPVTNDVIITLDIEIPKYVSRAGFKLEAALKQFPIDTTGLVVMDAGISTGGFTDCLLQHGAKRVYGVDVGHGQVHERVANDPRVTLLEKTNLRHLQRLPELVDLVTLDLSFISLLKVIPAVKMILKPSGSIITLIKPQFEADRADVGKGGIITSEAVHTKVIDRVTKGMDELGFTLAKLIDSPITGTMGNKEFLGFFTQKEI
ncbi:MAG: TlyA family RNA methyltransferase [Candidatus Babeliales bacterium]|jgi:23S rRNA (cytidine1920-2'-O)/16S rRNA (cytidine1409-2'-O)-methyltransferase